MNIDYMADLIYLPFSAAAVMASGITAASHVESSACRCFIGGHVWHYMVLAVAFVCFGSLYFLDMGPNSGGSRLGSALRSFHSLCNPALAWG